ncbi:hypothetical protein DL546_009927 [Coniochaeta pulveracea]|uniref:Uncharacterized protein n=1 Tax=Coniochaeta pulveracea TaxID=177199 RepID=A0A420Y1I8_9PEZI|nr:hypothetical protein DL546_009927 [Coniochaeta pulveracea]
MPPKEPHLAKSLLSYPVYTDWYANLPARPEPYPPVEVTGEIVVKDNKTQQDQIKYVYKIFLGERFCREEGCASTTVYKRTTHLTQHYRRKHDGAGNIPEGKQTIGHPPNDLDIQAALEFYTTWRSAFLDNGQPANYVQDDIAFVLDQGGSKRGMTTFHRWVDITVLTHCCREDV